MNPDHVGLYLHIPFCPGKCLYCSFNSCPTNDQRLLADYTAALVRQIKAMAAHPWCRTAPDVDQSSSPRQNRHHSFAPDSSGSHKTFSHEASAQSHARLKKFTTLFLGGGTPTILNAPSLTELITTCRELFEIDDAAEISVEANPGTVDLVKLETLRQAGVNRLSLGVQSFSDQLLQAIGRLHTADQAMEAVHLARQAGFDNISLDLISGLPGQTTEDWRQSVQQALDMSPSHLSLYELMLEHGSAYAARFASQHLVLPEEDALVEMDEISASLLTNAGFYRYEIANWCVPGRECRHNLNYWQNGSYLGLGAGAVSCFDGLRLTSIDDPHDYISTMQSDRPPFAQGEALSLAASFRETVIMGLRMINGINLEHLHTRYGVTAHEVYGPLLDELIATGLLTLDHHLLRLAPHALPIANQVLYRLV